MPTLTKQQADELLADLDRLQNIRKFDWKNRAFDKQIDFISDPSRMKASFTTRRGAKSYCDGIYMIKEAEETPKCNVLYLGLTRLSAKAIIWKDVLKDINDKDNLDINFHETELTATTRNGSVIYVAGVDVDEQERKKLFGRKYKLVVIDEAALYSIDLRDLVYVTLRPALADQQGTVVLSGMASDLTVGLFYDITTGKEQGWSLHQWSAHDNPFMRKQWAEELEWIAKNQPEFMKTPKFRQAYLNEWVVDKDALVYKYDEEINGADGLRLYSTPYRYVLGVDLGHSPDPSAFVVSAYHEEAKELNFVYAYKQLGMDVTDVANKVRQLEAIYNFDVKIIDNANKQAVAELNNRHNLNFIAAEKAGKNDFINLMNTDFIQGLIKVHPQAQELAEEWKKHVWVTESGEIKLTPTKQRIEHPSTPNHLADAGLYNWRWCYNYLFKRPEYVPAFGTQEHWEPKHQEKLINQIQAEKDPNHWTKQFLPDEDLFEEFNDGL